MRALGKLLCENSLFFIHNFLKSFHFIPSSLSHVTCKKKKGMQSEYEWERTNDAQKDAE